MCDFGRKSKHNKQLQACTAVAQQAAQPAGAPTSRLFHPAPRAGAPVGAAAAAVAAHDPAALLGLHHCILLHAPLEVWVGAAPADQVVCLGVELLQVLLHCQAGGAARLVFWVERVAGRQRAQQARQAQVAVQPGESGRRGEAGGGVQPMKQQATGTAPAAAASPPKHHPTHLCRSASEI